MPLAREVVRAAAVENGVCIAADMEGLGVSWDRADKSPGSRKNGWELLRKRLKAAREDSKDDPGLYVFETCTHFIRTVPVLPRDTRNSKTDDVDTQAEDHVGDETRYRVLAVDRRWNTMKVGL